MLTLCRTNSINQLVQGKNVKHFVSQNVKVFITKNGASASSSPKFIQTILSAHQDCQMWLTTRCTSWLTAFNLAKRCVLMRDPLWHQLLCCRTGVQNCGQWVTNLMTVHFPPKGQFRCYLFFSHHQVWLFIFFISNINPPLSFIHAENLFNRKVRPCFIMRRRWGNFKDHRQR